MCTNRMCCNIIITEGVVNVETKRDLDNLNIQSVICETCGTPVAADTESRSDSNGCPDCANYWVKEQIFRHFY